MSAGRCSSTCPPLPRLRAFALASFPLDPRPSSSPSFLPPRFDLLHVMVDEPDAHLDHAVAMHILGVHQGAGSALHPPYAMADMQAFIKYARCIKPRLNPAVRGTGSGRLGRRLTRPSAHSQRLAQRTGTYSQRLGGMGQCAGPGNLATVLPLESAESPRTVRAL